MRVLETIKARFRSLRKSARRAKPNDPSTVSEAVAGALGSASQLLASGCADEARGVADGISALGPKNMGQFGVLLRAAVSADRADVVAGLFARHVAGLETAAWPVVTVSFLSGLRGEAAARILRAALKEGVQKEYPGAVAVDACLSVPAGATLAERLRALEAVERICPEMLEAAPVKAALLGTPQPDGPGLVAPMESRRAVGEAARGRMLVVPSAQTSLLEIGEVLPVDTKMDVCGYRSTRASIDLWTSQARDPAMAVAASVFNTLESDSDLNDANHSALSQSADAIAADALRDPAILAALQEGGFIERHLTAAELALSDKIFAWFRTQHAFVKSLNRLGATSVLLIAPTVEVRESVTATIRRAKGARTLLVMEHSDALSGLTRTRSAPEAPATGSIQLQTCSIEDAAVRLAQPYGATRVEGVVASAGSRLYEPAAEKLVEALGEKVVVLNDLLTSSNGMVRFDAVAPLKSGRGWGKPEQRRVLVRLLDMDAVDIRSRIARIVARFCAVELPQLLLVDAASRKVISALAPRFAIVMPTRHPPLRILAANLRAHGAVVHEAQIVYLSEMPRYRPPLADFFHALDTHSAKRVKQLFQMRPGSIRVGGSLRGTGATAIRRISSADGALRVVLASQPEPWPRAEARLLALVTALKRFDGPWRLALRPHPADGARRLSAYKAAASRAGVEMSIGGDLMETDLLIAGFSNLVLEASVADIRTVIYWSENTPPPVPYAEMGLALQANSPASLATLIQVCAGSSPEALALDRTRRRYLKRNPLLIAGAVEAMVESIVSDP